MGFNIRIDRERCRYSMYDPQGCKKCLQICPLAILANQPVQKRDFTIPKDQRLDPTIWKLVVPWEDHCNGCGACVQTCPHSAIMVTEASPGVQ